MSSTPRNSRNPSVMGNASNAVNTVAHAFTNIAPAISTIAPESSITASNTRRLAEFINHLRNLSIVNLLAGSAMPVIAGTSMPEYLLKNPFIIACIAAFCLAILSGLYGLVNWSNINLSTINHFRYILGAGTIFMVIGIFLLIAGLSTTPNPEFQEEKKVEQQ